MKKIIGYILITPAVVLFAAGSVVIWVDVVKQLWLLQPSVLIVLTTVVLFIVGLYVLNKD